MNKNDGVRTQGSRINNPYLRERKLVPTSRKRRKLNTIISIERIRELLNSEKGEPVQALYTIFNPDTVLFDTVTHFGLSDTFVTYLSVDGFCFIGYGKKKITSRAAASKAALVYFADGTHLNDHLDYKPVTQQLLSSEDSIHTRRSFPDHIASLIVSKYEQLRRKYSLPWFKMIAGIISVENEDIDNAQVIVLSTGSKCIELINIRPDGSVIIDSHAETLTRRSFQYLLYSQLLSLNSENTILENNGPKARVRPGIQLYLFVNSAPCGDSRIFTVSDKDSSQDKHPNRISRGVLRIKLDGGNSTVPLTNFSKYDPKRLMIMSCSDKLLKSNSVGLQGSLLSNLIEPVYLDGVIIGNSFNESHVTRALYDRIESVSLPSPFKLHRPVVCGLLKNLDVVSKSPKSSVNWIRSTEPEIIDSTTGRTLSGWPSRLCKRSLFKQYLNLRNWSADMYSYENSKRECEEYQMAKKCLYQVLQSNGMGKWIERVDSFNAFGVEKDQFT